MSRLRWLFLWRRQHDDLAREMRAHIDERADALIDEGVEPEEAVRQARREFGNVELHAERSREPWIAPWLTSVNQDLRYAARALRLQPGFSAGVIGILAFAMGLVMTLFTAVNALLLRPWPVPDPASVALISANPTPGQQFGALSAPEFRYLRANTKTFRHLAAWLSGGSNLSFEGAVASAGTRYVTSNYFDALQAVPSAGRFFNSDDEDYGSPKAMAVVSARLAEELAGGAPIVGRTILVETTPVVVIGVTSATDARFGNDLWMPLPAISLVRGATDFDSPDIGFATGVFGRLASGVARERAKGELDGLSRQFRASLGRESAGFSITSTRPIGQDLSKVESQASALLMALLGLGSVLVLACANAGNLILARGLARRREIAIRLAIGASRARVVRQLLTEALLVSTIAGGMALWIGYLGCTLLIQMMPGTPDVDWILLRPDLTTVAVTGVLVVLAVVVAGLAPALRVAQPALAVSAREGSADRGGSRLRTTFLALQIALSMMLLVAAGLLTRAISHVLSFDPGFAIHEVQVLTVNAQRDRSRQLAFMRALDDALGQASSSSYAFGEFRAITGAHRRDNARVLRGNLEVTREVVVRNVTGSYFRTLDIPVVAGRPPSKGVDTEVIVNALAAKQLFAEEDPLGSRLTLGRGDSLRDFVVVGVAADVPVMEAGRIDPVLYVPFESGNLVFVRGLSPAIVDQVRSIARSIEPDVRVSATLAADDLRDTAQMFTFGSYFAWGLGGLALLLSTVGAFGVFAYVVEERRKEIGIRMALGASSAAVVRTVVGSVRLPLVFGLGGGLVIALAVAQVLRSNLYGLSPFDPITYLGIALILTLSALLATWIPARRATRVDPVVTLRGD